ncbi:MAG: type VII toxin-antitoxin system MntA family adenylyltransferase antitoxin [Gemmatimonadota bacterium]
MGHPARWEGLDELPGDLSKRIQALPAYLEREGALVGYLFGSLVENDGPRREPNDVDLAVLMEDGAVWTLRDGLRKLLGTQRLDLVDLSTADPVLRFEVIRSGHPIYWRDDDTLNRFELDTMHLYRDTAPMRARQREYLRERTARWS